MALSVPTKTEQILLDNIARFPASPRLNVPDRQSTDAKLVAHHVGARGFGVSLNVPAGFREDVVHVLYEADAEAVERMKAEADSAAARMLAEWHVLPYCLGRSHGKALLHVTANSYASSIFPPSPGFARYYCEIPIDAAVYDVDYGAMLEVAKKVEVEVHALDELIAAGKVPVDSPPDFLSLDTQGYERDILEGAKDALAKSVIGVVCEVEMIPMYTGQPLLGDILTFMAKQGFLFAGFTAHFEVSPYRAQVGVRGKAFPGFADALFLRDLSTLGENADSPERLYARLCKLAFVSVCFGYVEYALGAFSAAVRLRDKVPEPVLAGLRERKYVRFLEEMTRAAEKQPAVYPPIHAVSDDSRQKDDSRTSWYDKYHNAAIKRFTERQTPTPAVAAETDKGPWTRRSRLARAAYRLLPARIGRALKRRLLPPSQEGTPAPSAASVVSYTPFERVLDDWGFAGPAQIVRQRRLAVEPYLRSLDREMAEAAQHAHLPRA